MLNHSNAAKVVWDGLWLHRARLSFLRYRTKQKKSPYPRLYSSL